MSIKTDVDAENKGWQTDERSSPGIHIKLLKQNFVFPWTQLVYAEGTEAEVRIAFTTHDVTAKGQGLSSLLEDVATQRLTHLREPARTEKFTPASRPHITGLFVSRVSIIPDQNPIEL
jgi:hypothetical protein